MRSNPIVEVWGSNDRWALIPTMLTSDSFIISGGVGHAITFEHQLADKTGAVVYLFDPSPTGITTMKDALNNHPLIRFYPLGLAAAESLVGFGYPDRQSEGSYKPPRPNERADVKFQCTTIKTIMREHGQKKIDLLKIDVEGFEYEIINDALANGIEIDQICVELHHNRSITIREGKLSIVFMVLRLIASGYRLMWWDKVDFLFVRRSLLRKAMV